MSAAPDNGLARPLKAIALLLHYPEAELQTCSGELAGVLLARPEPAAEERAELERFAARLRDTDLFELQADYVATFDHSKKVSLYLFEHVYGESRDRGPAMVELINAYRERGLEIAGGLLPDYLPLFLEFCAGLPEEQARGWLEDTGHVLQQIHVRLAERGSDYALPLRLLLTLLGLEHSPPELCEAARGEERDDTRAAFDRVWMEAPVTFGPEQPRTDCGATGQGIEQPVQWHRGRAGNEQHKPR